VGVGLISQMPKVKESSAMVLTRFHYYKKSINLLLWLVGSVMIIYLTLLH